MCETSKLNQKVLVLNRSWYPISTTSVRSALSLLFQGAVKVICSETYMTMDFEEWVMLEKEPFICTPRFEIGIPEILLALNYDRVPKKYIPFSRNNVYKRDEHRCQYCGKRSDEAELTIDHIVPKSKGGACNWENCVTACIYCNTRKGAKLLREINMSLNRPPLRPKWTPKALLGGGYKESWLKFIK